MKSSYSLDDITCWFRSLTVASDLGHSCSNVLYFIFYSLCSLFSILVVHLFFYVFRGELFLLIIAFLLIIFEAVGLFVLHVLDVQPFFLCYCFVDQLFFCYILPSHFHMKIIATVTKSSHQGRGLCYLHLPIFFLYIYK